MNKVISYTVSKALAAAVIAAVLSVMSVLSALSGNMLLRAQEIKNAIAGPEGYTGYTGQNFIKTPENYLYKWFNERLPLKRPVRPFGPAHFNHQTRHHARTGREGEFILDTNLVYGSSFFYEEMPAISFDGTNYMLVWQDDRNMASYGIYGSRITAGGVLIDSGGIAISTNFATAGYTPAIAFDGTNYMVVFYSMASDWTADVYGMRIDPGGTVLDSGGIPISVLPNDQGLPGITYGGSNYMVAWIDDRDGDWIYDIYCSRVNTSGTVLDPSGVLVGPCGPGIENAPSIAFDGTNYLIVWQKETGDTLVTSEIYGARVSQAGTVLDPGGIQIGAFNCTRADPAIVFGGSNYLVVWQQYDTIFYDCSIVGTRVTPGMSALDPAGIVISATPGYNATPAVFFDGTNYMVAWQGVDTSYVIKILGARIDQAGVVLDPSPVIISDAGSNQEYPAITYGTNYLVAWRDYRGWVSHNIYGARVSSSGVVLDPSGINFSIGVNMQLLPAAAFDGTNYLVAWMDTRSTDTTFDIYGIRVSPTGAILDPASFVISNAQLYQYSPAAAFDSTNYFVVWQDERNFESPDVYGARVSTSGTVLDPSGIAVADGGDWQAYPALAFGDTNYFAVWTEEDAFTYDTDVYGARVTPAGTVLDPNGIRLSFSGSIVDISSIAFDGTNFLIAWSRADTMTYYYDIYGTRVSQSGTVLDPAGIAISTAEYDQSWPSIAFDGTNYLVTWFDLRNGVTDIYGARVNTSGTVLDPSGIAISSDTTYDFMPRTAFDGTNFVITWINYDYDLSECHLLGAKVNPSGSVVSRFPAVVEEGSQMYPALAKGQGNQLFLAYTGWADRVNGHLANTFRTWGKLYPFPNVEENAGRTAHLRNYLNICPNPFNQMASIKFQVPNPKSQTNSNSQTALKIYNSTGQLVKSFALSPMPSALSISWQGDDDSGKQLPAGVYFVTLSAGDHAETQKVLLIR